MTDIRVYDSDHEKLNLAASKAGESVATIIEWLIEEHLDDLIKSLPGENAQ